MATSKYLDSNGLLYLWQKIKTALARKVDTVSGKGLSTNDYTTEEKTKLGNISATAAENVIEDIKVNGTSLTVTAKAVNVTVPTNNNQLTNGAGYQTESQVNSLIQSAISNVSGVSFSVVESLPSTGSAGVIYLISNGGTGNNSYDEYIYVNNSFEKIGTTAVDLSGYIQATDTISNADIDTIIAT